MAVVLVVDDDHNIARGVAAAVTFRGYKTAVLDGGSEVIDFLRSHPIDLVVLDVSMPDMNGLDVLRALRADGAFEALPVVMFSGSDDARDEALRLGAVAYVPKHDAEGLLKIIDQTLGPPAAARAT